MLEKLSQVDMKEFLYQQFKFESVYEKQVFQKVFEVINTADGASRSYETKSVSASLISRLILLIRIDSTQFYDKTNSGDMKEMTETQADTSGLDRNISVTQPDKVVEVKSKSSLGTDRHCEAELHSPTNRGGKKIFTLFSNEDTSDHPTLHRLGIDLAQMVSKFSTANVKSISIADIVCYCIKMIADVKTGNELLSNLSHIITKREKSENICASFGAQEELRRLLTSALKAILRDIKLSVEAIYDFEYAWEACAHRSSHVCSIFAEGRGIGVTAKECAWILASTISLRRDFIFTSPTPSNQNLDLSKCKRKERIALSVACIALIARSTALHNPEVNTGSGSKEPDIKRNRSYHGTPQVDVTICNDEKNPCEIKSPNLNSEQSQSRLSLENDAIAALSMMITGNATKSNTEDHIRSLRSESHNDSSHCYTNDDVINTLTQIYNELLPLTKTNGKVSPAHIARVDLENEIETVEMQFRELHSMMNIHEKDHIAVELSSQTTSTETQKSPRDNETYTGLKTEHGVIDSLGGEKRKFDAIESYLSCLSTLDGLSSTKNELGLLYERFHNLLDERSNTKDIFSYFEKIKVVDATRLFFHYSTVIIQALMKTCLLESSQGSVTETISIIKSYDKQKSPSSQTQANTKLNVKSRNVYKPTNEGLQTSKSSTMISSEESASDRTSNSAGDIKFHQDDGAVSDWANKLIDSAMKFVQPSRKLNMYLDASSDCGRKTASKSEGWRGVLIPALNNALCQIWNSRKQVSGSQKNGEESDVMVKVDKDGTLLPKNTASSKLSTGYLRTEMTHEVIGRALVTFFYSTLEAILFNETARLKSISHPKLVMNHSFQNALISVCYICLLSTTGDFSTLNNEFDENACGSLLNIRSVLNLMGCTAYEYLKVSETFLRSLVASSQGLPLYVIVTLRETEEYILEGLLWSQNDQKYESGCTMVDVIQKLTNAGSKGTQYRWPPGILQSGVSQDIENKTQTQDCLPSKLPYLDELGPEYNYVTFLMKRILEISSQRIAKICVSLMIPATYPVASQIWIAFRHLLRNHIHLLYNRHVDQLILCTIFGICRVIKMVPEITFTKIVEVYRDINRNSERIISQVSLKIPNKNCQTSGNIIHLYNHVYVPAMKKYLLHNRSLEAASLDLKRCIAEGKEPFVGKVPFHQRVNGTNIFLNISNGNHEPHGKQAKVRKWDYMQPKTRVLYNFNRGNAKEIALINETVRSTALYCPRVTNITS